MPWVGPLNPGWLSRAAPTSSLYFKSFCSSAVAQDLVNTSRMIALYKDTRGASLRPIAIPTVWRKIVGRASTTHFRDVLRHAAGEFEYAGMPSDGGARMAAATRWQSQTHQDRVFVRTDIQNLLGLKGSPSSPNKVSSLKQVGSGTAPRLSDSPRNSQCRCGGAGMKASGEGNVGLGNYAFVGVTSLISNFVSQEFPK